MIKNAALEPSGVTDQINNSPIFVSTTARLMYRKLNPTWEKAGNKALNAEIAKQYSAAAHLSFFRPKKTSPNMIGEIRTAGGAKFIALDYPGQVMIIAVKGAPKLTVPAPVELPKMAARDSDLKAHRGFLENHFFDLFQGMYALDKPGFDALLRAAMEVGVEPIDFLRNLHTGGKDQVSGMSAAILGDLSRRQMNPEPKGSEIAHLYSVPVLQPA